MFRCPSCAKVLELPLTDDHALLSTKDMTSFMIYKKPAKITSVFTPVKDLFDLAEKMESNGLNFGYISDTNYIPCPSCETCSTFEAWHNAWNFPGDYFSADQLCSCGGELWYDKIPGSPRYALICEECGWIKPRAVISGHEGDVL